MDMGIDDFSYSDELENILDMCHYVLKKMNGAVWNSLSSYTKENWSPDSISPDGSDAFEPTGTINLYVGQMDLEDAKKIVSFIKYILGENDIIVGEVKWEKVKDKIKPEDFAEWGITDGGESFRVVRIPVIENNAAESGNPPQVNLTNDNAKKLFGTMLGFSLESGVGFNINAHELIQKIHEFRKSLKTRTDIPEQTYNERNRNIISPVHGKDYYYRILEVVENFAQWAINKGYTALHVA